MKNLCFFIACFALMACTLSVSRTINTDMLEFSTEFAEALRPAFAAHKLANFFKSTPSGQICWVCTIIMATMEKYVVLKNTTIDNFIMNDLCTRVPVLYRSTCQEIVNQYGPTVINTLIETESPDAACTAINYCAFPECKLYPKGEEPKVSFSPNWAQYFQFEKPQFEAPSGEMMDRFYTKILLDTISAHENSKLATWVNSLTQAGENPLDWLKELINKLKTNHTAIVDLDGDFFSQTSAELRGFNWRGRDCDDTNLNIHPGRKTDPKPGFYDDFNCNGIHGVDPATNQDYKDELCGNSSQMGIVVMGDSAGAHCEVPTQWVNASAWDYYTFDDLVQSLANELDLPHMSGYTGYEDTGYTGPVSSVYKYMYQRNKCNFRDYQNIAVNGLASTNAEQAIIRLGRSQTDDYPVLVFLELIGNDVCDRRNTTNAFTPVDKFRTNLIGILDTLDTILPAGSHLVALGLANGSLIFDAVNGRMHPAGVTYNQFYDFQNCVEGSLCWGWLNTNQTVRDTTTQSAAELSQVYSEVFSNYTAKNFDFIYYDFPTNEVFANMTAMGKDIYELIEPVDGFHPSQTFHAMLGDYLWSSLLRDRPDWLGPENPNNDRITQLFGDQGGY